MPGFLKNVDILSQKPELYINNATRFKTNAGGLLSILTLCLILAAAMNFTVELLSKKNSTIVYNQTPSEEVALNITNYPFIVMLQDQNFKPLKDEERLYNTYVNLWIATPDNSTGITTLETSKLEIQMERCNLNAHFGIFRPYFQSVPFLEHHYCPKQGANDINLYGVFGSLSSNSYMEIWMTRCDNSTRVGKIRQCFDSDTIDERLQNTFISFKFLDNAVNHRDINTPYTVYLRTESIPVSSTIYKRNWYYFKNVNYTSDSGLIFQSPDLTQFYQVSKPKETVDLRKEGVIKGSFSQVTISMDSTVDSYLRSYQKAQQTLANVGGITKGLVVIATCLNYIITTQLYFMELIKSIFSEFYAFDFNEGIRTKSKLFSSRTFFFSDKELASIKNNNWKTIANSISQNNSMIKDNSNNLFVKKDNFMKKEENSPPNFPRLREIRKSNAAQIKMAVTLTYLERICPMICFRTNNRIKKLDQYNIVKKYVIQELCIKNLISKMNELDKLKHVVLDESQLSVFQNIDNPPFHFLERLKQKNIKSIWSDVIKMKNLDQKEFPEMFSDLKKKENKSDIDTNMIHLVECILENSTI